MPKPRLTEATVASFERMLAEWKPIDYLGTDKEPAVRYMSDLVKHYRDPESVLRRSEEYKRTRALLLKKGS